MRASRIAIAAAAVLALLTLPLAAGDDAPAASAKTAHAALHTAQFKVVDLDGDLAKDLVKALAEAEGIVAAKPDKEKGLLAVTFDPAKTDAKQLQVLLREVSTKVSLDTVGPADPKHATSDCGKCPHAAKCSKEKDG